VLKLENDSEWVLQSQTYINQNYYGMGLTTVGDFVYMLTWRSHTILRFSLKDILAAEGSNSEPTYDELELPKPIKQAWGLSNDS